MLAACPCGSNQSYVTCCGLRHSGVKPAETAEALMRSRYSAFAMGNGEYILATQAPTVRSQSAADLSAWARGLKWLGLRVLRVERGSPTDARGTVEFEARFEDGGQVVTQREVSRFDKVEGRWRYIGGRQVKPGR
jgi:SEC-C motif-containing protein